MPAKALCVAVRQVNLRTADVDPHVGHARHEKRIARQTECTDIERGRETLVRDREIDVFEQHKIADVFTCVVGKPHLFALEGLTR